MPPLSEYLNADKNKTRIGYSGLTGYENAAEAMMNADFLKVLGKNATRQVGGSSGVDEMDGMAVEVELVDGITFVASDELKQVKLDVVCGYPYPMLNTTTNNYHMAAPYTANMYGSLNHKHCGFPKSLTATAIKTVQGETTNIKAGIGIDLGAWGDRYLKKFFGAGKIDAIDLKKLSKNGNLYAEVVVHNSQSLGSSGKVFYANVVDCEIGGKTMCMFSPTFCFGEFKRLGLDFVFNSGFEDATLQTSTILKPAKEPTYDYKTGDITNIQASTLETFGNLAAEDVSIVSSASQCCRIRLFVESIEAAQSITRKAIDPEMAKKNKTIDYKGGKKETYVGNATVTGNLQLDIANTAKMLLDIYTRCGFVYSQIHGAVVPLESSNIETWVKEKLREGGITHTTQNTVKINMPDLTTQEQGRNWPTADCSSFISSVLATLGVVSGTAKAAEYNTGHPDNLINGYRLESIDTPEMGCILTSPVHVGLGLSATQQADFGQTNWMQNVLQHNQDISHRENWKGRQKFVQGDGFKGTIRILSGYNPIGSMYSNYWRIVKK